MFNKKQNKLLLECVEHFISWEHHMGRSNKKTIRTYNFLGIIDKIPEYIPTSKNVELQNICKLLKQINQRKQ